MKKIRKVFEDELIGGVYYSFEATVWYWEISDSGTEYAPPSSEVEIAEVDLFNLCAYDREIVEADWVIVEEWVKEMFNQKFF